ncbi:uncharacterized protein LOC127137758 [Lathyrus oleraceus]|uniref:uncharacterized protein LOC127137758 n=1 Tax=Pisum sativum TaxID=3888 RepID=UPI0021D1B5B0|nr:uncharacterized protein LOC127137758 [Pisum sativum]
MPTLDNSTCNIERKSEHLELLKANDLIIWDEARMSHKNCFEALDKTLKDVMSDQGLENTIFGGKLVVFGGGFRQILPVVPRGGHSDIAHASFSSSYIWDYCQVLNLTKIYATSTRFRKYKFFRTSRILIMDFKCGR